MSIEVESKSEVDLTTHKDESPHFGNTVKRVRGGKKRATPVVAQLTFDENNGSSVELQALSGRKLKKITSLEEYKRKGTHMETERLGKAERAQAAIIRKDARGK